jgi:hypothetical protein
MSLDVSSCCYNLKFECPRESPLDIKTEGFVSRMTGGRITSRFGGLHGAMDAAPLADLLGSKDCCKFWTRGEIWRAFGYLRPYV